MKKIYFLVSVLILTGCNNENKKSVKDGQQTSGTISKSDGNDAIEGGEDPQNGINKTKDNGTNEQSSTEHLGDGTSTRHDLTGEETTGSEGKGKRTDPNDQNTNPTQLPGTGADANVKTNPGNEAPASQPGTGSTSGAGPSMTAFTENGEKTLVYVGTFAQWTRGGEQFDGSYDKEHGLFVVCQSNRCQQVPINQIVFPQSGSCDVALEDRIRLFRIKKDGSINPIGDRIKLVGTKEIIKVGEPTRIIKLDPVTVTRIKKATIRTSFPPLREPTKVEEVKPSKQGLLREPTEPGKKTQEITLPKAVTTIDNVQIPTQKKPENQTQISQQVNPPIRVQTTSASPLKIVNAQQSPQKEISAQRTLTPESIKQPQTIRKMITADTIKPVNKTRIIQESRPAIRLKVKP